jgi:hypothetical protein
MLAQELDEERAILDLAADRVAVHRHGHSFGHQDTP